MIKTFLTLTLLSSVILSPAAFAQDDIFGQPIKVKDAVQISEILAKPQKYLNKEIKVQGIVTNVCPMRGCWMKVQSDKKRQSLFIKVKDGEMVFPMSARGRHSVLQGKLVKRMMPIKEVIEVEREKAKKANKPFDPKSITKPRTVYMFVPSGVVIKEKKS